VHLFRMNKRTAKALLRKCIRQNMRTTTHCRERMDERDVTVDDILHSTLRGKIETVEWDSDYQNWKCKVKGTDVDGNELAVIVSICEQEEWALCITVF
jgi:hypothetical protein